MIHLLHHGAAIGGCFEGQRPNAWPVGEVWIGIARVDDPDVMPLIDRLCPTCLSAREALRRDMASAPATPSDWIIKDIRIGNVPPLPRDASGASTVRAAGAVSFRLEEAPHDPVIARTLIGGPGNRSSIRGCTCRDPGVRDAQSWAAHVGVPGGGPFIEDALALRDAARDVLDYPGVQTQSRLREVLERGCRAPRTTAP